MIRLSLFADDVTCIIKDKISNTNLFRILESFGECYGSKVNDEKTEIVPLGDNILQEKDFPKHSICEVIKIWGIYFGYDERQRNNLNFSQALKSIKKSINVSGNGEASPFSEEYRKSKPLLSQSLCSEHLLYLFQKN